MKSIRRRRLCTCTAGPSRKEDVFRRCCLESAWVKESRCISSKSMTMLDDDDDDGDDDDIVCIDM